MRFSPIFCVMLPLLLAGCNPAPPPRPAEALSVLAPRIEATGNSRKLPQQPGVPLFNLEAIGQTTNPLAAKAITAPIGVNLPISGWAADQEARKPAAGVDIVIDGVPYEAKYGLPRPDVAAAFGNPQLARTGFTFYLPTAHVPRGPHILVVRVISADNSSFRTGPPVSFEIQ